jgi:hypothetical protein
MVGDFVATPAAAWRVGALALCRLQIKMLLIALHELQSLAEAHKLSCTLPASCNVCNGKCLQAAELILCAQRNDTEQHDASRLDNTAESMRGMLD